MKIFHIAAAFVFLATLSVSAFAAPAGARPQNHTVRATLPPLIAPDAPARDAAEPLEIFPYAKFDLSRIPESSALAKSACYANTFWTLCDSDNAPVVFALRASGEIIMPAVARGNYAGIRLTGTRNIDWECLTLDDAGNLIVGDVGNNLSNRRNLCFYIVPEPNPAADVVTPPRKKVSFYYPTQDDFLPRQGNYDCESCFALNGQIYFFTKHWADTETVLWRVDPKIESYQAAIPVARFDARGMVTDAALSPSHRRLAILTYHGVWVFELPAPDASGKIPENAFFTNARAHFRRLSAPSEFWQIEGVAFEDENTLLIASEQGVLFRVPVAALDVSAPKNSATPEKNLL